jgi:diacylglycerol kinase family enzyme
MPRKYTVEQIEKARHLLRTAPTVEVLAPGTLNDVARATGMPRRQIMKLRELDLEREREREDA